MRTLAWSAVLLVLAACTPSDPAGWAKRAASRSRTQEKLEALEQCRKAPGDRKAAVPALLELLQQAPKVRAQAAVILGEIGDPAAAPGMIAAIDPSTSDRDGHDANRRLAAALGALRSKEAVPALQQLTASRDGFVQLAAVDALGAIGDPAAVDTLAGVARSPAVEPVTAQHAVLALGAIGDAKAAPIVVRMMFEERGGMSFYPQAAFAAIQIGKPMAARLLAVLEGKDAELETLVKDGKIVHGALYAKAAQLLGEVGGAEAVPALVNALAYKDADPGMEQFVRVFSAESLGRLRAREGVAPISALLAKETDPDARTRYCEALARIGDAVALPALKTAAASKGEWQEREGALVALSRLGGAAELPAIEAARAADCAAACPRDRAAALDGMKARLSAAAGCNDAACWAGKLGDPAPAIRDRAALEVGRSGTAAVAPALAKAMLLPVQDEAGVAARFHAVLALDWIAEREKLGAAGREIAGQIDGMIAAERGRRLTEVVNEDALRLAARLRRQ